MGPWAVDAAGVHGGGVGAEAHPRGTVVPNRGGLERGWQRAGGCVASASDVCHAALHHIKNCGLEGDGAEWPVLVEHMPPPCECIG